MIFAVHVILYVYMYDREFLYIINSNKCYETNLYKTFYASIYLEHIFQQLVYC